MASVKIVKTVIQIRRDTEANWLINKDIIPAAGEPCLTLDGEFAGQVKYGDGVQTWEQLKYSGVVKAIKHATQTPHHLAVAGNYNGETSFNGSWNGTVVAARMYDKALTPEQIKNKTDMKVDFAIVK